MDTQRIQHFFTRPEKSLLGVCSTISQALKLPPVAIRIAQILLTLLFIPLGIIVYIGIYLSFRLKKGRKVTFALFGAVLGIPLSYYFQSDIVKNWNGNNGVFSYVKNFTEIVEDYNQFMGDGAGIIFNVFLSMSVFALAGGAIGYFIDKSEKKTT